MATNYYSLITALVNAIKTNGTGAITGAVAQAAFLNVVESLTVGFQFMGVATPATSPDSNDKKEFYVGFAGTYANFGSSVSVPEGSIVLFKKNEGAWSSQVVKIADPVSVSQNTLTIGGTDVGELAGQLIESPEWVRVVTDSQGKILYGVKTDGKFYFGNGCPPQVMEYVNSHGYNKSTIDILLNTKVDKVTGKSLIDAEFASSQEVITNPEWIQVIADAEGKILEGITTEGKKKVMVDVEYPNGIPSEIKEYVDSKLGKDSHIIHIGDFQGADYEEVQDALNTIDDDTPSNPYILIIHPKGTAYAPFTMIRSSFGVSYPWTNVVPRNISIIGLDKEHCLFHSDKGDYNFPAAELLTNGIIKNLKFKLSHENYTAWNKQGGYAAHIDCATKDDVGYRMVIEDCDFESSTGPAVGISTHSNGHLYFRRCDFLNIADPEYSPVEDYTNLANRGAVLMHTSVYQTAVNQKFTLEDCLIKSTLGHKSLFTSLPNNASTTCIISFFKNICWSESENSVAADIDTRLTYNAMNFGNNFNV